MFVRRWTPELDDGPHSGTTQVSPQRASPDPSLRTSARFGPRSCAPASCERARKRLPVASVLAGHEAAVVAAREQGASLRVIAGDFGVSTSADRVQRSGVLGLPCGPTRSFVGERGGASPARHISRRSATSCAYWLGFIAADGYLTKPARGAGSAFSSPSETPTTSRVLAACLGLTVRRTGSRRRSASRVPTPLSCTTFGRPASSSASRPTMRSSSRSSVARHRCGGTSSAGCSTATARRSTPGPAARARASGHRLMLERIRGLVVEELGVAWSDLVSPANCHPSFATTRWRHPLDLAKLREWLYADATVWMHRKRAVMDCRYVCAARRSTAGSAAVAQTTGTRGWASAAGAGTIVSAGVHPTRTQRHAPMTGSCASFAGRARRSTSPTTRTASPPSNATGSCRPGACEPRDVGEPGFGWLD